LCVRVTGCRPGPRALANNLIALSQRHYRFVTANAELREMRADRLRNVTRRKMRIVLFRHTSVSMAKLFGDNTHRHAAYGKRRILDSLMAGPAIIAGVLLL
jgi:hypothetical protein